NTDQPSVATGPSAVAGQGSVWITYTDSSGRLVVRGAAVTGLGAIGSFGSAQVAPGPGGDFGDIAIGPTGQVMVVYQDPSSGVGPDNIMVNVDSNGLPSGGFGAVVNPTATQVGAFVHIPAQPMRDI